MEKIFTSSVLVRALVLFLFLGGTFSCKSEQDGVNPDPVQPEPDPQALAYIFQAGTDGYSCYRIPAIIKTKAGSLLAFAEARKHTCKDEGDIDLVVKRSQDGGKTWSKSLLVWDDEDNTCGNPAPVVDERTGKILLLMTWNLGEDAIGKINAGTSQDTRRVFVTESNDDGLSWLPPREITAAVKRPGWGWYATGPCHGIQLKKGPKQGRLVIPCDYIEVGEGRRGYSHVIFSDDGGNTWELGGISPHDKVNESTVAELSDGRLMLNMRSSTATRQVAISRDAGKSWEQMGPDRALLEPICQGSLLSQVVQGRHTLFFSNPASSTRDNMTIKMSLNDGETWTKSYRVHGGPAAYSDLVMATENTLGILYEAGEASPYQGIAFKLVPATAFE